jgi:hypothetical protein
VSQDSSPIQETRASNHSSKQNCIDLKTLSTDPGLRRKKKKRAEYYFKKYDEIRRAYIQKKKKIKKRSLSSNS